MVAGDKQVDDDVVGAVRAFNRYWTAEMGLLDACLSETPYSLTEARVLYELAHRGQAEVGDLRKDLALDRGYMSRILARFKDEKLLVTTPTPGDARKQVVTLTAKGARAFSDLDARAAAEVKALLQKLTEPDQRRVTGAMEEIKRLLAPTPKDAPIVIRPPRPGELGWVVERHGALYAQEYAWNDEFEGLVAQIIGDFVKTRDPRRDAAFVAEIAGERAGCVFCVKKDEKTAQLRLLLVEPRARGRGVGKLLVDECIRFARAAGYTKMVLWTNDVLHAARRIYERAGFVKVREGKHTSFGHALVEQTWALDLGRPSPAKSV